MHKAGENKTGSSNLLGNVLEALVRAAYDTDDLAIMGGHLELVDCEATGKRVNVDGKDCIIIALQTCFEAWYNSCHCS